MAFDSAKPPCRNLESRPGCIQSSLAILGDKWSPLLLGQLVGGHKTFGELELGLNGISPRTLSARLQKLQAVGIVAKLQYNAHPPRYHYVLTEKGRELRAILENMAAWGEKYNTL